MLSQGLFIPYFLNFSNSLFLFLLNTSSRVFVQVQRTFSLSCRALLVAYILYRVSSTTRYGEPGSLIPALPRYSHPRVHRFYPILLEQATTQEAQGCTSIPCRLTPASTINRRSHLDSRFCLPLPEKGFSNRPRSSCNLCRLHTILSAQQADFGCWHISVLLP